MSNAVLSGIRSIVQYAVTMAVAALATFSLSALDVEIDVVAVNEFLFALAFGAVVWALNALSGRYPLIARILSLGTSPAPPTYEA
jgi:hypothetical protein